MNDYTILGSVLENHPTNQGTSFRFKRGLAEISILAPDLFRFRMTRSDEFNLDRFWAIEKRDWEGVAFHRSQQEDQLILETEAVKISVNLNQFGLSVFDHEGFPLCQDHALGWRRHSGRCWKKMPDDAGFFGCGEKVGFLDRRGRKLEMWTTDVVPHLPNTDPMYQSIPFFIGLTGGKAFGIFFNNTHRSFFDFGKEDPQLYSFWGEDGELDYYFFVGPSVAQVVARYSELTGRMPLPPKWSLGFQQSRYSYFPEQRVREITAEFRRRDFPCDVIYFDIHYMDGYRVFTWDPQRFPEPERLLKDLRADGFKPVLIIDPGVKIDQEYRVYREGIDGDYFCRLKSGENFMGQVWPGEVHFPDFFKASTREWWGRLDAELIESGIAGIWNDMNEPSNFLGPIDKDLLHGDEDDEIAHAEGHNLYGFQMCKATYEGLVKQRPDERPFILTRSGFAGIQRYAAVWLGDNHSWWEHLVSAVPMLLNMSLSGVPFIGVDVGGFCDDCHGELFARWIAMGCFTPFFRVHTAIDTIDQEPWSFGPEVESIARKYIKLRYELLPYIYDAFRAAAKDGTPIMRPLLMDYQSDPRTHRIDDMYLFGPSLLVAPIFRPGVDYRSVYLPEGLWYNFRTGTTYQGKRLMTVDAPMDQIPLFVKGGSIIPRQPAMNYVGERTPEYIMFEVFPNGRSHYEHYEDDGSSHRYLEGEFSITTIDVDAENNMIKVQIGAPMGGYRTSNRLMLLKIHREHISEVLIDGKPVEIVDKIFSACDATEGWRYDGNNIVVTLVDKDEARTVVLS